MTTIDRTVEWVKANPDRVAHRSTGKGFCKESELEALLKEAVGFVGCGRNSIYTCAERAGRGDPKWCDACTFLARPDVRRWTE